MIQQTLKLIKEQTGLDLQLCESCTRIKKRNGRKYFNIVLNERVSESKEFDLLKRFADKYQMISVEANGFQRAIIFLSNC